MYTNERAKWYRLNGSDWKPWNKEVKLPDTYKGVKEASDNIPWLAQLLQLFENPTVQTVTLSSELSPAFRYRQIDANTDLRDAYRGIYPGYQGIKTSKFIHIRTGVYKKNIFQEEKPQPWDIDEVTKVFHDANSADRNHFYKPDLVQKFELAKKTAQNQAEKSPPTQAGRQTGRQADRQAGRQGSKADKADKAGRQAAAVKWRHSSERG